MATYVTTKVATSRLGIHANTLRALEKEDKIEVIWISGQRKYNVDKYIQENLTEKKNILYCRVSSSKQKADLERQCKFLSEKYPNHEIIKDIGSSLNFKRKGIQKILELAMQRKLKEVVVAHKDRLARIGFDAIKQIIELSGANLVVYKEDIKTREQEFAEDLASIVTIYSARLHGKRKYKIVEDQDLSQNSNSQSEEGNETNQSETDSETVDGSE